MSKKPTEEFIARLHREHVAHQEQMHLRIHELHERLVGDEAGERARPK